MKVEVLISTINQENDHFLNEMNLQSDFLVVNQMQKELFLPIVNSSIFTVRERGLSKSRNLAIEKSKGDVCLICDDDVIYNNNYEQIVIDAYRKIGNDASENSERKFADLGNKIRKLRKRDLLKVSSVRVSFRRKSIVAKNIRFNELFGSGSNCFSSGEENIFLFECFEKGLKVYYYPVNILRKRFTNSLWFKGFNRNYFFSKGALSKVLFGRLSFIYNLYFVLTKYKLYKNTISPFAALMEMKSGREFFLKKYYGKA